jgi:hypothetical protein
VPNNACSLAYDVVQKIVAIGTRDGLIKMYTSSSRHVHNRTRTSNKNIALTTVQHGQAWN